MPIYEYACRVCDNVAEIEMSISKSQPIMECPICRVFSFRRQIAGKTTFALKGSGWYADGYSSPPNKENKGE